MKISKMVIGLLLGIGLGFSAGPLLAQTHQHGAASEKSKAISAKPVPQKEPVQEAVPTVEIPKDKQQLIGLNTTSVAIKSLQKVIRTVGRIEYDERKMATVNTKYEGWIEKLLVNATGSYVKKGEPLAEIYSPEILATQREYLNALKWKNSTRKESELGSLLIKDAETILEGARQRLRLWDITEEGIVIVSVILVAQHQHGVRQGTGLRDFVLSYVHPGLGRLNLRVVFHDLLDQILESQVRGNGRCAPQKGKKKEGDFFIVDGPKKKLSPR